MLRFLCIILGLCWMNSGVSATFTLGILEQRHGELYDDPRSFRLELEAALPHVNAEREPELWAMMHAYSAEAAWFQEELGIAHDHVVAALSFAQTHKLGRAQALLTYLKGGVAEYEGKYTEAEPLYLEAMKLAKAFGDLQLIAYTSAIAAGFYHRYEHNKEAAEIYKQVFQLLPKLPQDYIYYDMLSSIGTLYAQTIGPKQQEGFQMLEESLDYAKKNKLRYEVYWITQAFHTLYQERLLFDKSEILLTENLQTAKSLGYENYIKGTLRERGRMRHRQGRQKEAVEDLEQVRDFYSKPDLTFYGVLVLADLGRAYLNLKMYDKIPGLFEQFKDALTESSSNLHKVEIKELLRDYYFFTGQKEKEFVLLRELLGLIKENADKKKAEELGRLTRDMEVQRQQNVNDRLASENKLQNEEIQRNDRKQKLMLGLLALGFFALLASMSALRRGRIIQKQRANLKIILDNIEEGILRFSADLLIRGEYSQHTQQLLGRTDDLRGLDVWQLLFKNSHSSPEDQQIWQETLKAIFGEDKLAWELNESHLPRELQLASSILSLDWQPLQDGEGHTQTMLLMIRDKTRQVEMQREAQVAQERVSKMSQRIEAIARGRPQRIAQFLLEAEKAIVPLQKSIKMEEDYSDIKRMLHTLKGAARSLGLKDLSEAVHGFEDLVVAKDLDAAAFQIRMAELQDILNAYRELLPHLNMVPVDQKVENLWDIASKLIPEAQQRLTARFKSRPQFQVLDDFTGWERLDTKPIHDMLLHALTNSIDHGYLLPHAKGLRWDEPPALQIEARLQAEQLEVLVRDNGFGIDWEKLQGLALERSFQPAPGRELTDLLFQEGTSTATQLSTTSGRGMGLSAIHDIAAKMGGDVALLNSERGRGTLLRILLPLG